MIGRMVACFVLHILMIVAIVTKSEFSDNRDVEIELLLKKLNKPAIKSIKSPDGDIIDCVDIKNHPIYDHPSFKNHIIQMRPSTYPEGWNNKLLDTKKHNIVTQLWTTNGKCPENSIPIRRTRREDILRTKSIERYGKKDPNSIPQHKPSTLTNRNATHEYAQVVVRGKFHGAKAVINVWRPYVQAPREFSLAQIWIVNRPNNYSEINTIEAGWQVYEHKYNDSKARFFVYWTADGYRTTGCYNTDCSGFVHICPEFAPGAAFDNVSTIDGQQIQFPASIFKDPHTGDWWLTLSTNLIIGYWPSTLFTHLRNGANEIQWGGEITDYKYGSLHTITKMGSGRFAQEGYRKASYFRNLEIVDESDITKPVGRTAFAYKSDENCYNIMTGYHAFWGFHFFYGGPGRNRNCLD